jgi:hypothetical protein
VLAVGQQNKPGVCRGLVHRFAVVGLTHEITWKRPSWSVRGGNSGTFEASILRVEPWRDRRIEKDSGRRGSKSVRFVLRSTIFTAMWIAAISTETPFGKRRRVPGVGTWRAGGIDPGTGAAVSTT